MKDKLVYSLRGGAMKALEDGRLGGHLIYRGDESDRDTYAEWFDTQTNHMRDAYPIVGTPVFFHHTQNNVIKTLKLGEIDEIMEDEVGLWVAAILSEHEEYREYIEQMRKMAAKGILGWSSGSVSHMVKIAETGHIEQWPIIEASITHQPAQPDKTAIAPTKSQILTLDEHHARIKAAEGFLTIGRNGAGSSQERGAEIVTQTKTEEEIDMSKIIVAVKGFLAGLAIKATQEEVDEMATAIAAVLQDFVGDDEGDMSEEEAAASAEEMVEKAVELLAGKAMTPESVQTLIDEQYGEIVATVTKSIQDKMEKEAARKANAEAAKSAAREAAKANEPIPNYKRQAGGFEGGQRQPEVTVELERRFAGASWQDMALFVKCKQAELGALPDYMRSRVTLGDVVSPEFASVMAHKMAHGLQASPITDPTDVLAIRSGAPWLLKANELDATDLTGQGLEWVGTTFDSDLWQRARHETPLLDMLISKGMVVKDVDPGTNKVTFAIDTGSGTVFTRGEPNSVDATGRPEATVQVTPFTTSNVTMTAKEHAVAYIPSFWLTEDTFVDTMQFVQFDMIQLLNEALESTLINGDTETADSTNVNLIDDTPATGLQTPSYIAWNGMRKNFLVTNSATHKNDAGGSLAITDYIDTRALFGTVVRNRKNNMLTIIDFDTEVATRKLVQLLTSDVAGGADRATMYTGALPQVLDGVDTYTSGQLALANSAGKIPAAGGTLGTIILAYAPYIAYGRKRQVEIEQQRDIISGATTFVASVRHTGVQRSADGSAGTYNVGV